MVLKGPGLEEFDVLQVSDASNNSLKQRAVFSVEANSSPNSCMIKYTVEDPSGGKSQTYATRQQIISGIYHTSLHVYEKGLQVFNIRQQEKDQQRCYVRFGQSFEGPFSDLLYDKADQVVDSSGNILIDNARCRLLNGDCFEGKVLNN